MRDSDEVAGVSQWPRAKLFIAMRLLAIPSETESYLCSIIIRWDLKRIIKNESFVIMI